MLRERPHEALGGRAAVPQGASGGARRWPPLLPTAYRRQVKHLPVYPGTGTVRGAIRDRLGEPWGLYTYALLRIVNVYVSTTHATSPVLASEGRGGEEADGLGEQR